MIPRAFAVTLKGRIFRGIFVPQMMLLYLAQALAKKGQNKSLAFLFQMFVSVLSILQGICKQAI